MTSRRTWTRSFQIIGGGIMACAVLATLNACSVQSQSFTPGDSQDCSGSDCNKPTDGGGSGGRLRLGANAPVAGGDRSKSPHYILIHTLGQPTQSQQKTSSPGYRLQGGLSGATGR